MQDAFNAIEKIPQPVIAAIHGACIGGGIDLIAACDIRLASAETVFSIKEVDIGLAADLGTLQRLPRITGNESLLRELAFTGRNFTCAEGQLLGLFSRVLPSPSETLTAATALAVEIAKKSPVAVAGTKVNLLYSRDHASVQDGLDYMTTWNMSALQSEDIGKAVQGAMMKETPTFSKL
jgi:delta(3,5)-delta(2,4)-dienoyl-CoA isomerase